MFAGKGIRIAFVTQTTLMMPHGNAPEHPVRRRRRICLVAAKRRAIVIIAMALPAGRCRIIPVGVMLMISKLILASSSERRRRLMAEAGLDFEVIQPSVAEPGGYVLNLPPIQQAEALAYFKARSILDLHTEATVLGADTIVVLGEDVLGKPDDAEGARKMLDKLSGTRHRVITGVAIVGPCGRLIASETTYVEMREMSPGEIDEYIESGEWAGKAGGYAIQETADRFISRIDGSFSNVVGLPMELVTQMLAKVAGGEIV